ncbi:MAG: DUF4399 domain-containing protein [Acidimicrobiales bacterium]
MARAGWAVGVALALVLVGCGNDDDNGDGGNGRNGDAATEATVSIAAPGDDEEVTSPVAIEMEADGITIEPAGEVRDGAGHFHIIVDVGCVDPGETIPMTEGYNHFGMGQTEAEVELEPGEHELCLQAGDGAHTALDATDEITITVAGA